MNELSKEIEQLHNKIVRLGVKIECLEKQVKKLGEIKEKYEK